MLIQLTVNEYITNEIAAMLINITLIQIGLILIETAMRFFFLLYNGCIGSVRSKGYEGCYV